MTSFRNNNIDGVVQVEIICIQILSVSSRYQLIKFPHIVRGKLISKEIKQGLELTISQFTMYTVCQPQLLCACCLG